MRLLTLLTIYAATLGVAAASVLDKTPTDANLVTQSYTVAVSSGLVVPADYGRNLLSAHSHGIGGYTSLKGALAENLMDEFYGRRGVWQRIEPPRVSRSSATGELILQRPGGRGRTGLDGLYIRYGSNGNPQRVMVAEAKAFGGRLSRDVTGERQFSRSYRESRLALTAQYYREAASQMRGGNARRVRVRPRAENVSRIPIDSVRNIHLWFDPRAAAWTFHAEGIVSPKEAAGQILKISNLLQAAADGDIAHAARVFHFRVDPSNTVTIKTINPGTGQERKLTAQYRQLPDDLRYILRESLAKSIADDLRARNPQAAPRQTQEKATQLVREAERRGKIGEFVQNYRPAAKYSPAIGVGTGVRGGAWAAIFAGLIDSGVQLWRTGQIDTGELGTVVGLGAASGFIGGWSGSQVQFAMSSSMGGWAPGVAGGFAGGTIAGAVFSYGLYAAGVTNLRTANRNMVAGVVGATTGTLAQTATIGLVATFGSASTGTAITALSGAAASNASLAWLGGGSLAAGGLGAAGGAVVLTAGVGAIVVGSIATVMYVFDIKDQAENRERIGRLVKLVHASLEN